jgi:Zn-dependent protease
MFNAPPQSPPVDRLETIAALRAAVASNMAVTGYSFDDNGVIHLHGRLLSAPETAYRPMRANVERLGYTPFLKESKDHAGLYELDVIPGVATRSKPDVRVNFWLYIATLVSVVFSFSLSFSANANQLDLASGLMFGLTLMTILTAHEMGHYVVGKLRGAPVTLPYFVPLPLISPFGTLGAVIVQREPFEDRRTLLEIGLAGPLAGFIAALPFMALGLALSKVQAMPPGAGIGFGDSLLSGFIKTIMLGRYVSTAGMSEHPIYLAAWFGLLVTGINLIPAGQLDGGHVAYALLGEKAKYLSYAMIGLFIVLSITVSPSWMWWSAMMLLLGLNHPPSLNQAVKPQPVHVALAVIALLVLVLVFTPTPITGM